MRQVRTMANERSRRGAFELTTWKRWHIDTEHKKDGRFFGRQPSMESLEVWRHGSDLKIGIRSSSDNPQRAAQRLSYFRAHLSAAIHLTSNVPRFYIEANLSLNNAEDFKSKINKKTSKLQSQRLYKIRPRSCLVTFCLRDNAADATARW